VIVPGSAGVNGPHSGPLTELERAVLLGDKPPSALLPVRPPDAPVSSPSLDQQPSPAQDHPPVLPTPSVQEPPVQEKEEQQPGPPLPPTPSSDGTLPSPQIAPTSPAPRLLPEPTPEPSLPPPRSEPQAAPSSFLQTVPPPAAPPGGVPAREEVNPDGTLKRLPGSSPLERLRQRWNR
jgi:hypothetical protein